MSFRSVKRQQGVIFLVIVLLLGIALPTLLLGSAKLANSKEDSLQRTRDAMAAAKAVLLARAVKGRRDDAGGSDLFRPGSFPCPDVDNDGDADGAHCVGYVGRFPYRTLETGDLRDGTGERLWYVLSPNFRPNDPYPTSDTEGQLQLTGAANLNNVVALLIAPDGVVGNQNRSSGNQLSVANYLEGKNAHTIDTSTVSSTEAEFESWPNDPTRNPPFNDIVLAITTDMFMPLVERRVARESVQCLKAYANVNGGRFPWAATDLSTFAQANNTRFGRLPGVSEWPSIPGTEACRGVPPYAYFDAWRRLIFYGVSEAFKPDLGPPGSCGSNCLAVSGDNSVKIVVMVAGKPLPNESQSAAARNSTPANSQLYLEADPGDLSVQNYRLTSQPDNPYSRRRPELTGSRHFNDAVECLSENTASPCTN